MIRSSSIRWTDFDQLQATAFSGQAAGGFFVIADSVNADSRRQTMRLLPRNGGLYGSEGVHLRHLNRANVLFLDGHVESLSREGFAPLGIQQMYDANLKVVSSVE